MTFNVDRKTVTEGDVVEIKWQCEGAEKVRLTIDNGLRSTEMPVELSGSKRFRLNRSKGRTRLTVAATIDGKEYTKTLRVKVKGMPVLKAETLDHRGRPINVLHRWRQQVTEKWRQLHAKEKMRMQQLPERKQVAVKGMAVIGAVLLVSLFWPRAYTLGMLALMLYFAVVLLRR